MRPGSVEPGNIIDVNGNVLSKHNGIIDFTIGQRKGIGIGGRKGVDDNNSILYVIALEQLHIIYYYCHLPLFYLQYQCLFFDQW